MSTAKNSYETNLVKDLAKLINEHNLAEIEYDTDGLRLRLTRTVAPTAVSVAAPVMAAPAPVAAPAATPAAAPAAADNDDYSKHPGAVKSPMVGVIYTAPEPGAAPYVNVGDTVSADQTLFLIEAMKTFNPVKAPKAGKVVKILVSDRNPVEYDEPLLILE